MVSTEIETKIIYEISEIDELLSKSSVLLKKCMIQEPDYIGFRHFFRHAYGYHLRWDLAKPLFENMQEIWNNVKNDILKFLGK